MSLIKCQNCGNLISDKASVCPKCNTSAKNNNTQGVLKTKSEVEPTPLPITHKQVNYNNKTSTKRSYIVISFILSLAIIGYFLFYFLYKGNNEINKDTSSIKIENDNTIKEEVANTVNTETICPEPRCGGREVTNVVAVASHTLESQGSNTYQAANMLDDNYNTAWATHFTGENITLAFLMNSNNLYKMSKSNGYGKTSELFEKNSRAKDIRIYINGKFICDEELSDLWIPHYITFDKEYNNVTEVKIVISSVYKGSKYNDLCISEVSFFEKENN
ncbi:hypothetical protein GKE84_25515 [Escherichia coli]|nr:hypothetical protein [Escherichia coli]